MNGTWVWTAAAGSAWNEAIALCWWAHLDSNQGPKDYESRESRKPEQLRTSSNNRIIGLSILVCRLFLQVCVPECAMSVPRQKRQAPHTTGLT